MQMRVDAEPFDSTAVVEGKKKRNRAQGGGNGPKGNANYLLNFEYEEAQYDRKPKPRPRTTKHSKPSFTHEQTAAALMEFIVKPLIGDGSQTSKV